MIFPCRSLSKECTSDVNRPHGDILDVDQPITEKDFTSIYVVKPSVLTQVWLPANSKASRSGDSKMVSEVISSSAAASMADGSTSTASADSTQALSTEEKQQSIRLFTAMAERSLKRTFTMFGEEQFLPPPMDDTLEKAYLEIKRRDRYGPLLDADRASEARKNLDDENRPIMTLQLYGPNTRTAGPASIYKNVKVPLANTADGQLALRSTPSNQSSSSLSQSEGSRTLLPKKAVMTIKPVWHAPWKLMRVVSGHDGWVHCIDVEPGNEWVATASSDRTVKLWDLATSKLKLTLTGHISSVKGLQISTRHPYVFSCGEDKTVKCWDLEQNEVIRHYHGHLNAVNTISVHPSIDIIATGGRDSTVRVWDIRTKTQILCFTGHTNTIGSVKLQAAEPQIISSSYDSILGHSKWQNYADVNESQEKCTRAVFTCTFVYARFGVAG